MTRPTIRNLLGYVVLWALNVLLGWVALQIAAGAVWGFQSGQVFAEQATGVASTLGAIASGLTMWLAANRPRLGREDISTLVNQIGTFDAKAVLWDVLHGRSELPPPLTDAEVDRLAERIVTKIEARMQIPSEAA